MIACGIQESFSIKTRHISVILPTETGHEKNSLKILLRDFCTNSVAVFEFLFV